MNNNDVLSIRKIPKDGRLDKYLKECSIILERGDAPSLERFLRIIFKDCMRYLKKVLKVVFPNIRLTIIHNTEEYDELCRKLDREFGVTKPRTKALIVGSDSNACIYIDFQRHFKGKPIDFITNLSVSYLEELVHSAYPRKSETELHEVICSVVEGFLEIKLPDKIKQERLKRAKIYNGY